MNIGNFEYVEKPKIKIRKFHIQTLTDEGFSQYTNKESYTHKYLKSMSPKRIKEIFDYDSLMNKGSEDEKNLNVIREIKENAQDISYHTNDYETE